MTVWGVLAFAQPQHRCGCLRIDMQPEWRLLRPSASTQADCPCEGLEAGTGKLAEERCTELHSVLGVELTPTDSDLRNLQPKIRTDSGRATL